MKISKFILTLALIINAFLPTNLKADTSKNTVSMNVVLDENFQSGKNIKGKIILNDIATGKAITEDDLKIIHTKKIHLLAIDDSLEDFHHIHPIKTDKAGEFLFEFNAKKEGKYNFWLDILPLKSGAQEYVLKNLSTEKAAAKAEINKKIITENIVDGYKLSLVFDSILTASSASLGTIKISDSEGKPVNNLQPVLGAFAHIVAFGEDLNSIIHVHPMGKEPEKESDVGGPELSFHIMPEAAGFIKLFVQIKINGKDIFVPLALQVANAKA